MALSRAVKTSLLVLLASTIMVTQARFNQITIRDDGVTFRVRRFIADVANPYRLVVKASGNTSSFFIGSNGLTSFFKASSETYSIIYDGGTGSIAELTRNDNVARALLADDLDQDMVHRRLQYACEDCEEAWDVVCDITLPIICELVGNRVLGTVGAQTVYTTCTEFGDLCDSLSAADACDGSCVEDSTSAPTPTTIPTPTLPPTPVPVLEEDACDPNPCENDGVCNVDPAGGHICDCASGFGGMSCQTDTSTLDDFFIEIEFVGEWTSDQDAVLQSAADRWSEVITDVPCGGSSNFPAGRLLITANLLSIDGPDGFLGSAGPTGVWQSCPTISATGSMIFDIDDIEEMASGAGFEELVLHEMGHVIGVGTLWGDCSTCRDDDSSDWKCPALIEVYNDLLGDPDGTEASVIETDGGSDSACFNFDETTFGDELMTTFITTDMPLSKITAASLEDTGYTVDPSAVDDYSLPTSPNYVSADVGLFLVDVAVDSTMVVLGGDGEVVEKVDGVTMFFS